MPYSKAPIGHSEFGGGPGIIDPMTRSDREALTAEEQLIEIYATNPAALEGNPNRDPETVDIYRDRRLDK